MHGITETKDGFYIGGNERMKRGAKNLREEVLRFVKDTYQMEPEYLWRRYPTYAVLRHEENNKWYGIIMEVSRETVGLEGEGRIDILNVKIKPEFQEDLEREEGILPAYHMNHKNWVSVLLDGTVTSAHVKKLLEMSYAQTLTKTKSTKTKRARNTHWLVPANPKYYDIEKAIEVEKQELFIWKQSNNIMVGDTVYLYVASPVSAIRFQCRAVEVNIPYSHDEENLHIKRVMCLQLLRVFDKDILTLEKLKTYGIYAVRGPRSMPVNLIEEIRHTEKED